VETELTLGVAAVDDVDPLRQPAELGRLFDRCHRRLYAVARRMSHDSEESRDLVQETFLRAARRIASVPAGDAEAEAWLVRVLVNLCRDRERRRRVRQRYARAATSPAITRADPEGPAVARATVATALATLPPRRRACLVLRELEGLSVREIAEMLGLQQVTVRWHLSASRRQLARWREMHAVAPAAKGDEHHVE